MDKSVLQGYNNYNYYYVFVWGGGEKESADRGEEMKQQGVRRRK